MPVYEYECENCGTRFERIQSINDEPIRQCPECAGVVHKVFHPAGIIFKGSGWYITDSRKSTSGTVAGESKPAETKPASAEAKPASGEGKKTEPAAKSQTDSKAKASDG